MPRVGPILACLMLLAVLVPADAQSPQGLATSWRVKLEITSSVAGAQKMFEAFDTASLNLYDFNGDGQMEIVSTNDNNRIYVLDARTGRALAELETYHYNNSRWPTRELNPVAIGDLYGDDVSCMVVPNSASFLTAFCFDAAASTALNFVFVKKWEVKVDAALYEPDFKATHSYLYWPENGTAKGYAGMDGPPYLSDVDGDGKLEVFVETDSWPGQFAFDYDGTYLWSRSFADGNAGAIVRNLDGSGSKEAVFFSDGGLVTAYDAKTGGVKWNFDTGKHNVTPGAIPVPGLVADLNGDGKYEVVFGARQAVQTNDPDWINQSHARYFALDSAGKILWNVSYDWMNPLQYNHPAATDVNGDGVLDVVFLDWNTIGHKPGQWNTTSRKSNLFALDGTDGSPIWQKGITVYWSNKDFVIMDVDGNGDQEIVAPTAKFGSEGLGIYDLGDGADEGWMALGDGWGMNRGPVAGDLYGDGKIYLVVPFARKAEGTPYRTIDVGYREGKLVIVETGAAESGVEFSANFLLNEQIDTGVKGTSGKPPPPPQNAAPSAIFNATVTGLTVTADGAASTDPEGKIARYQWQWGDGTTAEGVGAQHTYATAGSYFVTLTVTDDKGAKGEQTQAVEVAAPTPVPLTPTPGTPPTATPPTASPTPTTPGISPPLPTGSPTTPSPPAGGSPDESTIPGIGAAVIVIIVAGLALAGRRRM